MNKYFITDKYTISEAIDRIDELHERAVLVVNDDMRVIGVVSQGDIIRALSAGKSLYARIDGFIEPGFLYLKEKDMEKVYQIFKKKKITLMPIVDDEFSLKEVITLEDIYNYLEERN